MKSKTGKKNNKNNSNNNKKKTNHLNTTTSNKNSNNSNNNIINRNQNKNSTCILNEKIVEYTIGTSSSKNNNNSNKNYCRKRNFVIDAGPGCHIARKDDVYDSDSDSDLNSTTASNSNEQEYTNIQHQQQQNQQQNNKKIHRWVIDWEDIDPYEYVDDPYDENELYDCSDIAINYNKQQKLYTITLCNLRMNQSIVAYITIYDTILLNYKLQPLSQGSTITNYTSNNTNNNDNNDDNGSTSSNEKICTTLIILCPPRTFVHLCYIDPTTVTLVAEYDEKQQQEVIIGESDINLQTKQIKNTPLQTNFHSTIDTHDDNEDDDISFEDDDDDDENYYNTSAFLDQLKIDSDVQVWNQHPNPTDTHTITVGFPLLCATGTSHDATNDNNNDVNNNNHHQQHTTNEVVSSYLCTQGIDGQLTHFFAGNLHAIDFRCPIGTPIVSVGNGIVVHVQLLNNNNNKTTNDNSDSNDNNDGVVSGIAVSNLFKWNSIMIRIIEDSDKDTIDTDISNPLYVEYVHIASSIVQIGDTVMEGQIIGTSGSIGFCPEPHLHFAAYRSIEPTAPTCRVLFHTKRKPNTTKATVITSTIDPNINVNKNDDNTNGSTDSSLFVPIAGEWYNCNGLVAKQATNY